MNPTPIPLNTGPTFLGQTWTLRILRELIRIGVGEISLDADDFKEVRRLLESRLFAENAEALRFGTLIIRKNPTLEDRLARIEAKLGL